MGVSLLETVIAFAATVAVIAVLVPLALCYLLTRQITRIRPLRTMLIVVGFTVIGGPIGLLAGLGVATMLQRRWKARTLTTTASVAAPVLGRHWSGLVAEAAAARDRFCATVEGLADGPLRDGLRDIRAEVDRAVEHARRLADDGNRAQQAQRDILRTVDAQRRRQRRGGYAAGSVDLSTQAQHDSAERLGAAARRDLEQLQLVVGRLHELNAHALELSALSRTAELDAVTSIADRVAALREASAELEQIAPAALRV